MKVVILAAGSNQRMNGYVTNKSLLKINNIRLIDNLISNFKKNNLNDISIVTGHNHFEFQKKIINQNKDIKFINNMNYKKNNILDSLILALNKLDDDLIISYADIYFKKNLIKKIINNKKNDTLILPVLKNWQKIWKIRKQNILEDAETLELDKYKNLKSIGQKINNLKNVDGQFMGVLYIPKKLVKNLLNICTKNNFSNLDITTFLNLIKDQIKIKCFFYYGHWYEFDNYIDYVEYKKEFNIK